MLNLIKGERIYLRELSEKDASEEYCSWLNDPIVNKYLETREATVDDIKKYIKAKKADVNCRFYGIFCNDTNGHIGNLKLEPIDFENKKATVGILIGDKDSWGKGIGTEATKLVVQHAFSGLGLEEVNLGVITNNKAAIRVYEKAGFKPYMLNKKALDHGNTKYDQLMMRITRNDVGNI